MPTNNAAQYQDPANGSPSSIGEQAINAYYQKQALIDARKLQFFTQLADVTSMPKNFGKTIKRFHYIPMLDDHNLNDQGLDAAGATISSTSGFISLPSLTSSFAVSGDADAALSAINAITPGVAVKTGAGPFVLTYSTRTLAQASLTLCNTVLATVPGSLLNLASGNLYGSSKDVGTISGKLPVLSETGGRVNRVGFKRKEITGSLEKFGFFEEYTQESLDFDNDADLAQHINREMLNGASELSEDMLQLDLLNSAGVIRYTGAATSNATIGATSEVTYSDLMHMSIDLTNNRTPMYIKQITGTRLVDTRVIPGSRVMYIGSEMLPTLKAMKDLHGNPAFIAVEKYAAGGDTVEGEIGAIDQFRFVIVPEMMKWAGAGGLLGGDANHYSSNGRFDVFPMITIGCDSFTTIGFQTDGKTVKFVITHKKPGLETADRNDPYGEMGFMSIKWYYGFMALRPERIGLIKTAARL